MIVTLDGGKFYFRRGCGISSTFFVVVANDESSSRT